MLRLVSLLVLGVSMVCSAQPGPTSPAAGSASGSSANFSPPGFPDVLGGRYAVISMKDVQAKAAGLDLGAEPKLGARFKKEPTDRVIVGDPDGWMANLEAYRQGVKRASDVLPNSTIQLSSLEGTPFEKMTLLGYLPAGGLPQGPWTAVQRLFAKPPGELVLLREWDFGLDGGGVVMFDEMLNTKVGHARAIFTVTRSGGTTQTLINWVTGTRQFELLATCKLANGCTEPDEWRDIAASIPEAPQSKLLQK
jgi:hypothetical protein